jgi:hypothetical protein
MVRTMSLLSSRKRYDGYRDYDGSVGTSPIAIWIKPRKFGIPSVAFIWTLFTPELDAVHKLYLSKEHVLTFVSS